MTINTAEIEARLPTQETAMDDKRTDKVSAAPGDVERLAKALEWKVDKDACANSNSHADYIEWQAAATLLALSAEVERLKGALRTARPYVPEHHGPVMHMIRAALGE